MLLPSSIEPEEEATAVETATGAALSAGLRTADLCREGEDYVSTRNFTKAVLQSLE